MKKMKDGDSLDSDQEGGLANRLSDSKKLHRLKIKEIKDDVN